MNPSAAQNFKRRVRTYGIDQDVGVADVIVDAFYYAESKGWNARDILRLALETYEAFRKPNLGIPVLLGFVNGCWVHRAQDIRGNFWYCRHQKPVFLAPPEKSQWYWSRPKRTIWRPAADDWGMKMQIANAKPLKIIEPTSWDRSWREIYRQSGHNYGMHNNSTVLIYSDGTVWYEYSPENVWYNLREPLHPKAVLVQMMGTWHFRLSYLKKLDQKTLRHNVYLERKAIAERLTEQPILETQLRDIPIPPVEEQPEIIHLEAYNYLAKATADLDETWIRDHAKTAVYYLEELSKVPAKNFEDYLKES